MTTPARVGPRIDVKLTRAKERLVDVMLRSRQEQTMRMAPHETANAMA